MMRATQQPVRKNMKIRILILLFVTQILTANAEENNTSVVQETTSSKNGKHTIIYSKAMNKKSTVKDQSIVVLDTIVVTPSSEDWSYTKKELNLAQVENPKKK